MDRIISQVRTFRGDNSNMAKIVKLHAGFAAGEGNKIIPPRNGHHKPANWKQVPGHAGEAVFQPNGKITQRLK